MLFMLFSVGVYAQDITVRGSVVDQNGEPVIGASVKAAGSKVGAVTNANGEFLLKCPANSQIEVSYIGFAPQTVNASDNVNIVLSEDVNGLNEVVVTALGIKKDARKVGYAVSQVKAEDLVKTGAPNFASALYGKAAGVRVQAAPGGNVSAVSMTVRGLTSISGNTQPLIVLDGVPIRNGNTNNEGYWDNQRIRSNGLVDINPEDIESISVLKGAAATALYGSEGNNGVVMITTKKGTNGTGTRVDFNANVSWDKLAYMPDMQTEFGPGYDNWAFGDNANEQALTGFRSTRVDRNGNSIVTPCRETYYSYGARFDANKKVTYFDGTERPFTPIGGNQWDEVFRTGFNQNYNVAIMNGSEHSNIRFSYSYQDVKSMQYNSNNNKHNFNLTGAFDIAKNLKLNYSATYLSQYIKNRPYRISRIVCNYSGMFGAFTDVKYIREHTMTSLGYMNSVYAGNGGTTNTLTPDEQFLYTPMGSTSLMSEYFWNILGKTQEENHNRLIASVNPTWEIVPGLTLSARVATDFTSDKQENKNYSENSHIFSSNGEFSDYYGLQNSRYEIVYGDAMLSYDKIFADKHNIQASLGYNARKESYFLSSVGTSKGLSQENWFNLNASVGTKSAGSGESHLLRTGAFATATYGFDNWAYLEGSIRNEKTSTLKKGNNSFWYPSVSASIIFTEMLKENNPAWYDYGKIRVSYGIVGNDPGVYFANNAFSQGTLQYGANSIVYNYIDTSVGNESLRPEKKKEFEVGLESKFFKNRLGFELTYYNNDIQDQLLPTSAAAAMGARSMWMNIGDLTNKGLEFAAYGTPVETRNFRWDLRGNIAWNKNEVKKLADGLDVLSHSNFDNGAATLESHVGEPMGDFYSYVHKHVYRMSDGSLMQTGPELDKVLEDGTLSVQEDLGKLVQDGYYVTDTSKRRKVGNAMPKLVGGFGTSLTWKNLTLDMAFDFRVGGDVMNLPWQYYMDTGIIKDALGARDGQTGGIFYYCDPVEGVQSIDNVSSVHIIDAPANYKRGETKVGDCYVWDNGVIQKGVKADGSPNDVLVTQFAVNDMQYGWCGGAGPTQTYEDAIQDNSYVKCREISLAYTLPRKFTSKFACDNITISAFARNPFYIYRALKLFDAETTDGTNWVYQAQVGGSTASARTFGVSLRASFGGTAKKKTNNVLANYTAPVERVVEKIVEKPVIKEVVKEVVKENTKTIPATVIANFGLNSAEIQNKAALNEIPAGTTVEVVGYASPEGTDKANMSLSQRRAEAVAKYLETKGVKVVRTTAKGEDLSDFRIAIVTVQ
jgi:TonB-linked SusC/RagA family outer membrane protein